ncbi:MAG: glycosyltransferase family 2 protein [Thermodesulfovibrionales bacterium]
MKRLSVIAVNYNSSNLLKRCIFSIGSTINNIPLEVIIVDNGSRKEDRDILKEIEGCAKIIFKEDNHGYAKAVNEGIRNACGDFILITNPDVLYIPYSINNMVEALTSFPRCGAVGPRTWWDEDMRFMLPFSELVTPFRILKAELMTVSRVLNNTILKNWIRHSLGYWLSEVPIPQEMLSGACIMTTKRVISDVGGFDEAFPLYFEDTDWCLRVRKKGYRLYMIPDAQIVHYYNQSARQELESSQEKFNYSSDKYLRKHFKLQLKMVGYIKRLFKYKGLGPLYEDMGITTAPPLLRFKNKGRKLILLSPLNTLIPSAGAFVDDDTFTINEGLWRTLGKGRYFMKAFMLECLKEIGAWSWIKG